MASDVSGDHSTKCRPMGRPVWERKHSCLCSGIRHRLRLWLRRTLHAPKAVEEQLHHFRSRRWPLIQCSIEVSEVATGCVKVFLVIVSIRVGQDCNQEPSSSWLCQGLSSHGFHKSQSELVVWLLWPSWNSSSTRLCRERWNCIYLMQWKMLLWKAILLRSHFCSTVLSTGWGWLRECYRGWQVLPLELLSMNTANPIKIVIHMHTNHVVIYLFLRVKRDCFHNSNIGIIYQNRLNYD